MSVPTERSEVRAPARITEGDAAALRAVLVDHRRARADQIEALLLLAADGAEVERRELVLAQAVLADVEAALARLEDGTYGWCVRCTEPIGATRLQAAPRTRFCIDCALER